MKKLIITSILMFCLFFANAQRGWELGGWIGISHYFGDLNTEFRIDKPGFAGGLVGRYNFNTRVCLKMSANYGRIAATDANSNNTFEQERNLSFQSRVFDGAMQFEFNFLPYIHGSKDENYTPYLFAGFNVYNFNPQAEYEGELVDLRPLGTEGQFRGEEYYATQGGFVYGAGFKIDINYEWSINVEISARRLFTDYLDDVSGVYPDSGDLEALRGELAVALSDRSIPDANDVKIGQEGRQRGNSKAGDAYVFFGAGVVYYFGSLRCPTISNRR